VVVNECNSIAIICVLILGMLMVVVECGNSLLHYAGY